MPCHRSRLGLLIGGLLMHCVAHAETSLTDGPYVIHGKEHSEAQWVCAGSVEVQRLDSDRRVQPACGSVPALTLDEEQALAPDSLPAPRRWAALSDIHGQAGLFLRLLQAHEIVDADSRWIWGDGLLVIAGDVFDRGPEQVEALWAIYRLAQEAAQVGGRVELLPGNHEAMVLAGDLRYLHPRYFSVASRLGRRYDQLFAADTELGAWLRRRATVLKVGDTLFMHGGLHPDSVERVGSLAEMNARFRARLGASRDELLQDPEAAWLFGNQGPLWYRGYFFPERATLEQVEAVLAHMQVRRIVVGHTTLDEIQALYGGRVIGIDAGIKDGQRGELLIHDQGQLWRGGMDGGRVVLGGTGQEARGTGEAGSVRDGNRWSR